MKFVTSAMMRELDACAIQEYGVPGELLMERAGVGVAGALRRVAEVVGARRQRVLAIAGHGNNGGDVFVAARHLSDWGFFVEVRLAGDLASVTGDARTHMDRLVQSGISVLECADDSDWPISDAPVAGFDFVIDGILGTGISGAPRGVAACAIEYVNVMAVRALVVSVDIPSGLDGDTGEAAGAVVTADVTVAMGLPKVGYTRGEGLERVGSVEVVDIGIPEALIAPIDTSVGLICRDEVRRSLPRRSRDSHKGTFGHVLLIGGAAGYSGAINMATRAALRSGAGLVSAIVPKSIASSITGSVPEVMVHGVDSPGPGSVDPLFFSGWERDINDYDAVVMGPGMTTHENTRFLMQDVLRRCKVPLVLDADALNVQRCEEGLLRSATCPMAITPHPAELGRFLERDTQDVQSDRIQAAIETALNTNAVVVLKGSGTVVAAPGAAPDDVRESTNLNLTGNPGMSTGGSGDVLAGLLGGFLAQGLAVCDAACAATFVHGCAGDRAAWKNSQGGTTAGDIIDELSGALRDATGR